MNDSTNTADFYWIKINIGGNKIYFERLNQLSLKQNFENMSLKRMVDGVHFE